MIELNNGKDIIKIKMSWKYLSYSQNNEKVVFLIEPMMNTIDLIYIPTENAWKKTAPEWAKNIRDTIINSIKMTKWNREIKVIEVDSETIVIPSNENEVKEGTIESTQAGKEFLGMDLFDPNSKISKEQAHELWCILEKRFASEVEGKVTIEANSIVKDSVFEGISVPTLFENPKAFLNIIGR